MEVVGLKLMPVNDYTDIYNGILDYSLQALLKKFKMFIIPKPTNYTITKYEILHKDILSYALSACLILYLIRNNIVRFHKPPIQFRVI